MSFKYVISIKSAGVLLEMSLLHKFEFSTVQTFAYDGHVLYLFCPVGFPLPYVEDSVIPPSHSSGSPDLFHYEQLLDSHYIVQISWD